MKLSLIQSLTVAAIAVLGAAGSAQAAQHTLIGTNFDLTYDDTTLGLFGAPTLVGNNLFFTFNTFEATAANGSGIDSTTSSITGLVLTAKNGFQFGSLALSETGNYQFVGTGNFVNVEGELKAFDVANSATSQTIDLLDVSPGTPLTTPGLGLKSWVANALIDASSATLPGSTNVIQLSPTQIGLSIQNTLTAFSDPNGTGLSFAQITKSYAGVGVTVSPVPEASTTAMLMAGLGVLGLMARRRRAA